jgi:hypothetical protein
MKTLVSFRWWSVFLVAGFALLTWLVIGAPMLPLFDPPPLDAAARQSLMLLGFGLLAGGVFFALCDMIFGALGTPPDRR